MAEALKHLLDPATVRAAAAHLTRVAPDFPRRRFLDRALGPLEELEFKARALCIADALEACLPADFERAADLLEASFSAPLPDERPTPPPSPADGLAGWILWPVGEFVARRGLAHPERALATLHALTQRFTAEFALRPFLVAEPELAYRTLGEWVDDPSAHVRRLVSEGTRPRLPWGARLPALIADPAPNLPLLAALQDDPSAYVRRSVANHLNDLAQDHPALVAAWVERHLPGADPERRALLRHASRTLIKAGDRRVLRAFGLGGRLRGSAALHVAPARVAIGEAVHLTLELTSTGASAQKLAVDYLVHHVKADGSSSPKVFKGWVVELAPRAVRRLEKRQRAGG